MFICIISECADGKVEFNIIFLYAVELVIVYCCFCSLVGLYGWFFVYNDSIVLYGALN